MPIDPGELVSLAETLDLLSEPGIREELAAARAAIEAGDHVTEEELRSRYLAQ